METPLGEIEQSLKKWIETNLPMFLSKTNESIEASEMRWTMPIVEDYALVVAVRDYEDGGGGTFVLCDKDASAYRIRGLLAEALNN